jgi:hypothetical protein
MEKKDISLNILFKIGKNYNMREVIVSQKKSPVIKVTGIKVMPFALLLLGFFVIVICSSAYYIKNNPVIIERKITVRDTVIMTKEKIKIKREKVYTNLDATINSIKSGMKLKENKSGIATLHGYTPFQIGIYILKAHESFRPGEYSDGQYNSKGFGLNLSPEHVKWATKKLGFPCRSRDWTYEEGVKLLYLYYEDMKNEVKDKIQGLTSFNSLRCYFTSIIQVILRLFMLVVVLRKDVVLRTKKYEKHTTKDVMTKLVYFQTNSLRLKLKNIRL